MDSSIGGLLILWGYNSIVVTYLDKMLQTYWLTFTFLTSLDLQKCVHDIASLPEKIQCLAHSSGLADIRTRHITKRRIKCRMYLSLVSNQR
jgi:hypothetical protein